MENIPVQLQVEEILLGDTTIEGYHPLVIETSRGSIDCRYYHAISEKKAVIFVGGVGGGFDSPAQELYPRLSEKLQMKKVSSLRIQFREPTDLVESVTDVVAGITFLNQLGIEEIALVGHSFGGAVMIQAASNAANVRTIVTLATQAYGAEVVNTLPDTSILLIHGTNDEILPAECSLFVHDLAVSEKKLSLYKGSGHNLNESSDEVHTEVYEWLLGKLNR